MKNLTYVVLFAFSAMTLSATDLKGKTEVDLFGGGIHVDQGVGNHGIFGFSAGYGVASMAQIFGEYSYAPVGSQGVSAHDQNFIGGVKVNLAKSDKFDPYGLFGFGGSHLSADCTGCTSENDKALHLGGGVRIYAKNKQWGVTPEFRYIRIFAQGQALNVTSYTGGVFFQWGK
jgi:hypothetical protein